MAGKHQYISWKDWGILVLLCLLAFALRTFRLDDRSLWIDEGMMLSYAEQPIQSLFLDDGTGDARISFSPLHALGLVTTRSLGGESVFSLRLVSVWAGVLVIPLLYLVGKRLFGRAAGQIAASLGAVSPYLVWYAQAALPESLYIALALLSIYTLHRLLEDRSISWHQTAAWLGTNIAILYSHRTGAWILAFNVMVTFIYVLLRRRRPGLLVSVAVLCVLAWSQISQSQNVPSLPAGHRPSWYEARALITERDLNEGSSSTPQDRFDTTFSVIQSVLRVVPAILLMGASLIYLLIYPRRSKEWLYAAGLLCLPPVLAFLGDRFALHESGSQYALGAIPAVILLQGAGATALWRHQRMLSLFGVVGALAIMGYWTAMQYTSPSFTGEDLKAAAELVSKGVREGDVVVLHDADTQHVWERYYGGAAPVRVIPHITDESWTEALDKFRQISQSHQRVWLIYRPMQPCVVQPDPLIQFSDSHWVKFEEHDFSSPWLDVAVKGYMTEVPVVESVPDDAEMTNLCWPEGLCFHAWSAESVVVGAETRFTLYWSQERPIVDDYQIELELQDSHRQAWSEYRGSIFPFYPASRWPTGSILRQELAIQISPAMPPEDFSLAIMVKRTSDGQLLATDSGRGINMIGEVSLERPSEPIPPDQIEPQYKIEADFGKTIRLLGYSLPNDTPRPGHTGFIDFYWETVTAPEQIWWQQTRLIRNGVTWVEKLSPLSLPEFEMTEWLAGDLVWGRIFLPLPGQMPPGEYAVEVSLLDPDGIPVPAEEFWRAEETDRVTAGPTYVESWPMDTNPPTVPHRPDVIFGNAIRLWGYDMQKEVRSGEQFDLTLVWRDEIPMDEDYHVFVHLMDEDEGLLGQADGVPVRWMRPTSTWRPGEFIVDHYSIQLPTDLEPGVGYLWVGLYHPSGEGRLIVADPPEGQPDDRVLLDIVAIEP